ncbi:MAG TPA: D-alanyl-D-alanine carboxypeptidase/D-alanyl-D-alanine-endopeptidase [Armatimonadota bacterium]|nr:D-alanyl-D-alanine carboxypeptidase/D-alanyl-D-alanine-endopeptidase [Armatimonadota bacterium]
MARVGVEIRSLNDGTSWYSKQSKDTFIPASTAKLVTASLALENLSPEYRFTTAILTDGSIENGILQGNLIIRGGGDPSLSPADLQLMVHALAIGDPAKNIQPISLINGQIIYDDSFFPLQGPQLGLGWEAEDIPWYYAVPSEALSYNRNSVTVTVKGTTPGSPATISFSPETNLFVVDNRTVTSDKVVTGSADVMPQGYHLVVTGSIAPGASITEQVSVLDPIKFFDEQFRKALTTENISVINNSTTTVKPVVERKVIVEHQSAPIRDIVRFMLKNSDNHTAEQVRWTLLSQRNLEINLDDRYQAILDEFTSHTQLDRAAIHAVDGSGLSRENTLSPLNAVRLLTYMASSPNFQVFYDAMPIAGVDGTLKNRMVGTKAAGNVHAKTGTMRGVCTLAGYVTTSSGERLSFAIFVNDYNSGAKSARDLQDQIAGYLAGL